VPTLLDVVTQLGLTPRQVDYVIPTHVHLDHAGGTGPLMEACPHARLIVHPKGAPHLLDPTKLTAGAIEVYGKTAFERDFGRLVPVAESRTTLADDGLTIDLGGRELVFIDTPGHANHHGCIFDARTRGFFTGDTFGIAYRELDTAEGPLLFAPTTPVAFDPDRWLASLDRLMAFQPATMYLTHFGPIAEPDAHVDALRQSIRDMAALALAEEEQADAGRQVRLEHAVNAHLISRARAHGVTLAEAELTRLLSVDSLLNAQGLEVWLRRRARRAAEAPQGPSR
jgi:glyoxylase-like metal-dependent hydrolase (beta-lactamase superfamily II)